MTQIDTDKTGDVTKKELCAFLVERLDEMVVARGEAEMLERAFSVFRLDEDGCVSEKELRRVFCEQNRVQLFGVDAEAFDLLKAELQPHATGGKADWRVPLSALMKLPAFAPLKGADARRQAHRRRMSAKDLKQLAGGKAAAPAAVYAPASATPSRTSK